MAQHNYTAWYDNEPEYKRGDVVFILSGGIGGDYLAASIQDINIIAYTEKERQAIEENIHHQKVCCGRRGRGLRTKSRKIQYVVYHGNVSMKIPEAWILGGVEKINEHIKDLTSQIDSYERRIRKVEKIINKMVNDETN